MAEEYLFRINDSYTPATIPMERLGEYVSMLARLLGETPNVHFSRVTDGSVVVHAGVDGPARPKVRARVADVQAGRGPRDAMKAFATLDEMLRKDNATGMLEQTDGAVILTFPGRDQPEPLVFGPFRQDGTLDGQVLRVGGKDDTVPVHLRDGAIIHTGLYTTPELARQIAQHLLGPVIRVHGTGTWFRANDGTWELQRFKITEFELLSEEPLTDVVEQLRSVKGSSWSEVPDPVRTLLEERHGGGEAH